jgi:hypothetical protein
MTCAVCGSEFCWLCMKEISGKRNSYPVTTILSLPCESLTI